MTKNTLEVINGVAALYSRTDVFDYELEIRMVGQETFETDPWSVQKVPVVVEGATLEQVVEKCAPPQMRTFHKSGRPA